MTNLEQLDVILHRIRVKLYPNYLKRGKGAFIARTANEKTLSSEDVCSIMKTRAGFTGDYDDLMEYVRRYNDEVAYQLADGYAVNNGYYCIYPNIGGTFNSAKDVHDPKVNPISFRFGIRSRLRNLIKNIAVDIDGVADTSGFIDKFVDFEEASEGAVYAPEHQFAVYGHKIKLAGDDPEVGVYFVPEDEPEQAVKVSRLAENSSTKITGIAPDTKHRRNRIEIRTQYSGSGTYFLKTPRVITSGFVVEAAG